MFRMFFKISKHYYWKGRNKTVLLTNGMTVYTKKSYQKIILKSSELASDYNKVTGFKGSIHKLYFCIIATIESREMNFKIASKTWHIRG